MSCSNHSVELAADTRSFGFAVNQPRRRLKLQALVP